MDTTRIIYTFFQNPENKKSIQAEIDKTNCIRLFYISVINGVLSFTYILFFLYGISAGSKLEYTWRLSIIAIHVVSILFSIVLYLYTRDSKSMSFVHSARHHVIPIITTYFFTILAAIVTTVDQMVSQSVTPMVVGSVAIGVMLIQPVKVALPAFSLSFILFVIGLNIVQPDDAVILSNTVQGITASGMGLVLTFFMWRAQVVKLIHEEQILAQKQELLERNNQLRTALFALEEANADKSKFITILGHDIRSPLSTICNTMEILSEEAEELTEYERKRFVDIAHRNANNTLKLLENILLWIKTQSGQLTMKPESIDLNQLMQNTIDLLLPRVEEKGIVIELSIPEQLSIKADRDSISTVFRNILSNAIKFTNARGLVQISAISKNNEKNENIVEITIKDSGIGMNEELVKALLQGYAIQSSRGTNDEKGSGLGLHICKELIEKNLGTMHIYSKVGEGSSFVLQFPAD